MLLNFLPFLIVSGMLNWPGKRHASACFKETCSADPVEQKVRDRPGRKRLQIGAGTEVRGTSAPGFEGWLHEEEEQGKV